MFYSETLLSKTGPLSRVWLSANIERKLSKQDITKTNIESSVNAIVGQDQAPLALRLSGQLLLGVVRIYSRKASYLLEDAHDAINKIKQAFKTGNIDLPQNHSHAVNPASLTLPDALTEFEFLGPGPDPSLLLDMPFDDSNLLNFDTSQHLSQGFEHGRQTPSLIQGSGFGSGLFTPGSRGREIEAGRRDSKARPADELDEFSRLYDGDDLEIDIGEDPIPMNDTTIQLPRPDLDDDLPMLGMDDDIILQDNALVPPEIDLVRPQARPSQSPLSSVRSSAERQLEQSFRNQVEDTFEPEEESVHHAQRAKRRKVLEADSDTQIHSNQIRQQQVDRSKILKPISLLPRDPLLMALLDMQKTGAFVSSILGDGRSKGWAPELRGILSLEVIRGPKHLKRKRDSGIGSQQASPEQDLQVPEIHLPENLDIPDIGSRSIDGHNIDETIELPAEDGMQMPEYDDEMLAVNGNNDYDQQDNFNETTMPLLHPADSGPVSLGTKHAVHILREKFGADAAESPSKRQKNSVLFQELLPMTRTSRADATKMFFEVLVLATKDAIKVDQAEGTLGGALRVRGKRGLWGAWAETEAGGEIASQEATAIAV